VRVVICLAGIVVLVGTTSSALRTLVVPRRLRSKLTSVSTQATLAVFRGLARATRDFASRDRLLAWAAPISILVTLAVWLTGYLVGYSLVLYGLSDLGVTAATREAGSSLFTLGFASSDRQRLTAVDFLAAATGPVIMGLLIGYLSAVYAAYNSVPAATSPEIVTGLLRGTLDADPCQLRKMKQRRGRHHEEGEGGNRQHLLGLEPKAHLGPVPVELVVERLDTDP